MHTNTIVSILGLAASVSAHITMNTPKGWDVNNSPLKQDGSDFPCKGVAYDSSVTATKMNKGEQQPMKFKGSAVHGGGSCQVSLTTDTEPTKDSVWKVIKTFEGGCPAKGIDENYPENAEMELPDTYNFEIPKDVPAGKYTLAWTWFNKIGNREMYMNCAPVEAEGQGGDKSSFDALPDMFKANIYNGQCETTDSQDLKFPDPGQYVEKLGSGELAEFAGVGCPDGAGGSGSSSGGGSDSGSGGGSEGATPSTGSGGSESSPAESGGAAQTSAPVESAAPSAPAGGGIFAPIDGSSGSETPASSAPSGDNEGEPTAAPEAPAESSPAESSPTGEESALPSQDVPANGSQEDGSSSGSGSSSGGSGGYEAGADCQGKDGVWNCIGGNSYQRCGSGVWTAVMQLAEGTQCTPGEGENIQMTRKRGLLRFGAKFLL